MPSDVFERYAPFVQDFIYDHDWRTLRGVQVAAGEAIFDTDDNVLLTASTASGKTEAAFFPILTQLWEDPPRSVGAIYIGPLKALINDQFVRLNDLCAEAEIPVWHWHGDVAASHKQRMMRNPSGILQITPESLEALLMHKHSAVARLFCDLRYVVIDEVHSLLRGDRGGQTLCLIERLSRMAGVNPRRIGLSATIGDPRRTAELLSQGTGRGCVVPTVREPKRTWRLSMEHFFVGGPQVTQPGKYPRTELADARAGEGEGPQTTPGRAVPGRLPRGDRPAAYAEADGRALREAGERRGPSSLERAREDALAPASDVAPEHADPGIGYIFEHTRDKKCLVFVNSREECETVTTTLRQYCEAVGEPDRFLIHHGNLSASLRESAEDAMRDESRQLTTVTTATLELGIDIGRLERAFQIDAPYTVSSFLQRMGRTGRRGEPPEMWFVMREDEPEPRTLLPQAIPWKLVQGIALVQLYLEDRWVEPPRLDRLPYSLLYHQTMAELASCGEMTPAQLADRVLNLAYFHRVSADDFRVLLRHLIATDHVETTEGGGLIVGLAGERVTNSYRFYATFQDNEEYTCRSESQELGTIVKPPPVGEKIAIAGAVWIVEEVDHRRHLIYCTQVKGKVPAYFGEDPGDIHTRVLERMRDVLGESQDLAYPYLMPNARARLAQARHMAQAAGMPGRFLVNLGGDSWALFPWLGTYPFLALERLLKIKCAGRLGIKGFDSARPFFVQFRMDADEGEFLDVVREQALADFDPMELLYPDEVPVFDKYDDFLPEELVRKGFAYGVLDVEGMRRRVAQWGSAGRGGAVDASRGGDDPARAEG
ncbi:MAG: DEAD/DEAH box helicase [Coriobacteriales bacterium]